MRIVIVGAGEVGSYLAKFLVDEHHDVTMVDKDGAKLSELEEQIDLRTFCGSGASVTVLEQAEVGQADLLLAMTDSDEINMLASYFGKCLGAKRRVARVASEDELTGNPDFFRKHLGIDLVVNPAKYAAAAATSVIFDGSSAGITEFGYGRIHCRSFEVHPGSPITRKPIKELNLPGALIAAVARNDEVLIPSGDDLLKEHDRLIVICREEAIKYVQKGVGESNATVKSIFIIGGGDIGRAIAHNFDTGRFSVKLFEDDTKRAWELANELKHVKVLDNDGLDINVLDEEYIESAHAFIAATGSDEKNLMACALAKEHGVPRTIAVVDNAQYTELGHKLGLTVTLAPRLLAAERILEFVRGGNVKRIALLAGGRAEVIEFQATEGSMLVGKPLKDLNLPKGVIIGAIIHGPKAQIPKGTDEIVPGDLVVIFTTEEQVGFVEKLLSHEKPDGNGPESASGVVA